MQDLTGGNSNQVRREGNTVIRQSGVWSPFVHQLLQHLTREGFTESPIALALTETTETLSFLEGTVGNIPLLPFMQSDAVLIGAAQLLRRFHDATASFIVPDDAEFFLPSEADNPHEVICHNDFAPYNCVFRDGHPVGMIDFDTASPGTRLWDVAYTVYRFVPLMTDIHCMANGWEIPPDRATRLRLFCDTYGLNNRDALLDTIIHRLEALIRFMQDTGSNLEHIPLYTDDIAYIRANQTTLEAALF
ncbi:MAG: phosphotransferase enzyme family protein [Aggregatilineales bacterium]